MYISKSSDAWKNRTDASKQAKARTVELERNSVYNAWVQSSIKHTVYYSEDYKFDNESGMNNKCQPAMSFLNADTVEAVDIVAGNIEGRICILNFASFTNPGGKFLEGSLAQEEAICHNSTLYNVLREFDGTYYSRNRRDASVTNGYYFNRALYSPGIGVWGKSTITMCDVITCAAPNLRRVLWEEEQEKYFDVLQSRCNFIRDIFVEKGCDIFILGAFGCGVFENNPRFVADAFCKAFFPCKEIEGKKLIFAVPGDLSTDKNAMIFSKIKQRYALMYYGPGM